MAGNQRDRSAGGSAPDDPLQHLTDQAAWYEEQVPRWTLGDALQGGTPAMRAAGPTYLPKFPNEPAEVYTRRLGMATLNNFYAQMGRRMIGFVFGGNPVQLKDSKLPEEITSNVDRRGNDVHAFARAMGRAFIRRGLHHIFVTHPPRPEGVQTAADDQALGLRPYWANISATACFNAFADAETGEERLTHVRWCADQSVMQSFQTVVTERIRVLELTDQGPALSTYEATSNGSDGRKIWQPVGAPAIYLDANGNALPLLPWVTAYTEREGFMRSKALLDDIAHKNVEHWQSASDQRNILTVTRYPTQYQIGTAEPVLVSGPHFGLHSAGNTNDRQAVSFGWIGAPPEPIAAGERDLERIIAEAEALGVQLMTKQKVKTAAQAGIEFSQDTSPLQEFAQAIEDALNGALRMTALYLGMDPADAGKALIDKEFGAQADDAMRADALLKARMNGDVSRETLWTELQRLGVLGDDFDVKAEVERLKKEEEVATPAPLSPMPAALHGGAQPPAQPGLPQGNAHQGAA